MDKPVVRLVGENGNAFVIIAACVQAGKKAGWDKERIEGLKMKMMSGDYDHLLQTAMKHFEVE